MINKLKYFIFIWIFFTACSNAVEIDDNIPSNLTVNIYKETEWSGTVNITATADNTVEFMLIVDNDGQNPQTNTSGNFNHTFSVQGNHIIEVRAYGNDGRYIKESREINISFSSDVPIDRLYNSFKL